MIKITKTTSARDILDNIRILREQKGKEKQTLEMITKALEYGHDFVINLFWEQALTYQHMYMNDPTDKRGLKSMEKVIMQAKYWIEKYRIKKWYSRLYRFQGRISDYKGTYAESIAFYKKSIKFVALDIEPFRKLELEAFLSFAEIMSGNVQLGYKSAKKLFNDFETTQIGKSLKKKDYQTWAIWRSGITIRTIDALVTKKYTFNKKEAEKWLFQTKKDLQKENFSYREIELKEVEKRLRGN